MLNAETDRAPASAGKPASRSLSSSFQVRFLATSLTRALMLFFMVSMAVFALSNLLPGDPAVALAGESATPEVIDAIRKQLGYDKPWLVQYLDWLVKVFQLEFGQSLFMGVTVESLIIDRVPPTVSLTLFAISVAIVFGILAGVAAATHRGQMTDKVITALSTIGIATPNFWVGMILIIVLSFGLEIFPSTGYTPFTEDPLEWLMHIVLPGTALGMALGAELQRQTRSSISDVLSQDYIRTARAQGLSRAEVLWKRALKNGSGPLLTVIGFQIAILMGGSVVVEKVFSIPGMGTLMIEAVFSKDLPVIQAVVLLNATFVIIINLLTDVAYKILNPKVRIL